MKHKAFETKRLRMHLIKKEHAGLTYTVLQSPNLYSYIPQKPPTLKELEKKFEWWEKNTESPDGTEYWLNWIVVEKVTLTTIGTIQIGIHKENREGAIAYMIGIDFQGKGYGTEAVKALLDHCHTEYSVQVFKAWIDTRNIASLRLVQKIGMNKVDFLQNADHFDGENSDEWVFELKR